MIVIALFISAAEAVFAPLSAARDEGCLGLLHWLVGPAWGACCVIMCAWRVEFIRTREPRIGIELLLVTCLSKLLPRRCTHTCEGWGGMARRNIWARARVTDGW